MGYRIVAVTAVWEQLVASPPLQSCSVFYAEARAVFLALSVVCTDFCHLSINSNKFENSLILEIIAFRKKTNKMG